MNTATEPTISTQTREQQILEHLPQVRYIARTIHDRLPDNISLDDLVSSGIVGLISAIDRYDETKGVKLRTFAEYKIRGAILDSLRDLDWTPRRQRRRAKQIQHAVSVAEQRLQKLPTEEEIASELEITVDEYREWASDARSGALMSLQSSPSGEETGREIIHVLPGRDDLVPSKMMEARELRSLIARALDRMPHPERTVLSLYYHEELTLREISNVLDVHESRVSQLKMQGLARLRAFLDRNWPRKGALMNAQTSGTITGREAD